MKPSSETQSSSEGLEFHFVSNFCCKHMNRIWGTYVFTWHFLVTFSVAGFASIFTTTGNPRNRGSSLAKGKWFISSPKPQAGSGVHAASCTMAFREFFRQGRKARSLRLTNPFYLGPRFIFTGAMCVLSFQAVQFTCILSVIFDSSL
jgi:hypothetical protein